MCLSTSAHSVELGFLLLGKATLKRLLELLKTDQCWQNEVEMGSKGCVDVSLQ